MPADSEPVLLMLLDFMIIVGTIITFAAVQAFHVEVLML
jgi:hypothetical protein